MPLPISSAAIREKNKLDRGGTWIILLSIVVPGLEDNIRVTSNNEETIWNGNTYLPFPFEIDEISDSSTGEVPRVDVRVSNITRAMEGYLQEYDHYTKLNGYSPIELTISVVHSAHLDLPVPETEYVFHLKQPKTNAKWATFTLGANNPFNKRFPLNRLLKNRCRYKQFRNWRCGYAGAETTCDRTLARCRELGNSERFGGSPGVGNSPVFI
jgi:phage-related protein